MATVKSGSTKLQTNLVGHKVHLLTDEEARDEAKKQEHKLESDVLKALTAEMWFPALKGYRQRFGGHGEIVAVHLAENRLVYTIAFNGQLVELLPELWRLDEPGTTKN